MKELNLHIDLTLFHQSGETIKESLMETKKTNPTPTKVSVNNSLTQYEELSELELETVSGGKRGGGGGGRDARGRRTTQVMGLRG